MSEFPSSASINIHRPKIVKVWRNPNAIFVQMEVGCLIFYDEAELTAFRGALFFPPEEVTES